MIRHLLLLHPSGVPLYTSSFEKGIDCCSEEHKHHNAIMEKSTLFSSFLTSINILATEFGGNLRQMKLGQWDVFMESREKLTGVILTNPSNDNTVHEMYAQSLTVINSKFLGVYEKDLEEFNGEVSKYKSFIDHLNYDEIMKIDNSNTELCFSCIEVVNQTIEKIT